MRHALPVFGLISLLACASACTHPSSSSSSSSDAVVQAPANVIATLVTNDAKVTILGAGRGGDVRVTVRKNDGSVLADGISIEQLRSTDPTLHAIVTSAIASSSSGTYLDATLDSRSHPTQHRK